ncbi:MAG TPA: hypothetical protein VKY36_00510 [Moheibacter sp.]|nr:hypothetical protein [Moheibacter sp.]
MNRQHQILTLIIFMGFSFSFLNPDYLEWSKDRSLSFADFKGTIPKNTANTGKSVNLTTVISYEAQQAKGQVPKISILNLVDRKSSWIKVKKQEILQIQQIKFDYSELYARKIRKEMADMNKKGIKDKQKYIDVITKIAQASEKRQKNNNMLLEDQPHLIKIMKKDIQDSLNLYKEYAK